MNVHEGPFPFMRLVLRVVLSDLNGYRIWEFEAHMSRQCEDRTYADTASDVQDTRILLINAFLQNDVLTPFAEQPLLTYHHGRDVRLGWGSPRWPVCG
jgi:hypothetical protein